MVLFDLKSGVSGVVYFAASSHTTGVGTYVYAAPEQLKGSHYDSKVSFFIIHMVYFSAIVRYQLYYYII